MKTLDEVIEALVEAGEINLGCINCAYADSCGDDSLYDDALHYLKEYRKLDSLEAVAFPEDGNPPLTWDELREMEGKPVWVEWTKTEESYWCFVGEWFDDDEMRIYHIGRDYADYIHKTIYTPDIVQAFRKERE